MEFSNFVSAYVIRQRQEYYKMTFTLQDIKQRVLDGGMISREEAVFLADYPQLDRLCDAAD